MASDPHSRIYWRLFDDPKFAEVREDVCLFGAWALLLVLADIAWPGPAFVPPPVSDESLAKLVDCKLVDMVGGRMYRIHGLDAERDKRSQSGRNAAAVRWHSDRNADV